MQGPGGDSIGTVGEEYDAWTEEGILEHYWGEHIHLGYYTDEDMAKGAGTLLGCRVKDFVEAKFDFVDKMLEWSGCPPNPAMVLDVGCGIGGTSRHLAKALGPRSKVQGITLSPNQVQRATELAATQGVDNASFRVMNALEMEFPDDTFDLVWACESGEHMPDKKKYVEEMIRVLKPGGTIVDRDVVSGAFYTLVSIRPRSRGERHSLRTLPGASLRPHLAFNPRPRRL